MLSNPDWWPKYVVPTFGMSKVEIKDLASTVGLESAGSTIFSFTISVDGASKDQAIQNVRLAENFFCNQPPIYRSDLYLVRKSHNY